MVDAIRIYIEFVFCSASRVWSMLGLLAAQFSGLLRRYGLGRQPQGRGGLFLAEKTHMYRCVPDRTGQAERPTCASGARSWQAGGRASRRFRAHFDVETGRVRP